MKTILVELKKDYALKLLEALEQTDIIRLLGNATPNAEKKFTAVAIDTTNFKFDRTQANER